MLLKDPYTRVRGRPLLRAQLGAPTLRAEDLALGPHDVLGFRNRAVPNLADVIAIGDSQTYGNNAALEQNWPSLLERLLAARGSKVYSMATGGWAAVQYLDMFSNATVLLPRVVVVAFYSGNDALESFNLAYSVERWASLRPDPALSASDTPPSPGFPPPDSDLWPVRFADGTTTVFSPTLRLVSNQVEFPAVKAGYAIMTEVGRQISAVARDQGIHLVYTVIPTKELVYARRVEKEGMEAPTAYRQLVSHESENIAALAARFAALENVSYVDLVGPLQKAAMGGVPLYPDDINGHPIASGYAVIAQTLARTVALQLPEHPPRGLVLVDLGGQRYQPMLATDDGLRSFASSELIEANGWTAADMRRVTERDVLGLPLLNVITSVQPERFGPQAFN
jgi:lysophospholipase L1-like esterase